MSSSKGESFGTAKKNEMVEIGRFESQGPAVVIVKSLSTAGKAVVRVEKNLDASLVATDKHTAVTAEDTGYTGNGSTTDFSGEVLDHLPVVPGSIEIKDVATAYDLVDGGDGFFYTDDEDEDVAGTIDYFTGAMVLAYPTGKEPDSGNMTANYYYEDTVLNMGGVKTHRISNVLQDEELVIKAASDVDSGTELHCEMISTWE